MSLDEVIRLCTDTTARTMGVEDRLGTLKVGAEGDVTIMRLEEGRFEFRDRLSTGRSIGPNTWAAGVTVVGSRRLSHVSTVKGGRVYRPWLR